MVRFRVLFVLVIAALASGQGPRTIAGVITDSMCANGDHSQMRMGSNDAECTRACVEAHGALFVLFDGKSVYTLSDQKTPDPFAGQKVTVTGIVNEKTKTIQVASITAAK